MSMPPSAASSLRSSFLLQSRSRTTATKRRRCFFFSSFLVMGTSLLLTVVAFVLGLWLWWMLSLVNQQTATPLVQVAMSAPTVAKRAAAGATDSPAAISAALHTPRTSKYKVPPVYMVYNRVDYLKQSIDSLRSSDFPRSEVPVVISHDGHVKAMVEYVESLVASGEFNVVQIFHPNACLEHPDTFPGDDPKLNAGYKGDAYGNKREGKMTCCKHHFTWLMNHVFGELEKEKGGVSMLGDADGFLFLEEDYVVADTIYETVQNGMDFLEDEEKGNMTRLGGINNGGGYFGLTFDITNGYVETIRVDDQSKVDKAWKVRYFRTGPMVFRRNIFEMIRKSANVYCTYDDYNWDWSLMYLMTMGLIPAQVLTPETLQVAHIGFEGGMHPPDEGRMRTIEQMKKKFPLGLFHGKVGHVLQQLRPRNKIIKNGGWGHPADHEHCLNLFKR